MKGLRLPVIVVFISVMSAVACYKVPPRIELPEETDRIESPGKMAIPPQKPMALPKRVGFASFYSDNFEGQKTANGERFSQKGLTAAHRNLAFGSRVRVTNLRNKRTVIVRINDRGPFAKGRIIDLSRRAARQLGLKGGTTRVELQVLGDGDEVKETNTR